MSEDLTKKNPDTDSDQLTLILTIVQKLDKHQTILSLIVDRLGLLSTRVDDIERRLDALDTRVGVVESRLDGIEARLQSLEQTIKRSVQHLGRGQTVLNDAILKIHIDFLDIDERLQGLEPAQKAANSST